MPLYEFTLIVTATHRVRYRVGSPTGMMAVEAGMHGQARGVYLSVADVLRCELEPGTLKEIEHEDEAQPYPEVVNHKVPLRPEELAEVLVIIRAENT